MNPVIQQTIDAMTAATSLDDSILAFINGVPALVQAAVAQALANGATEAQLAPFGQLATDLQAKSAAIQAALTQNTPVTPAQARAKK